MNYDVSCCLHDEDKILWYFVAKIYVIHNKKNSVLYGFLIISHTTTNFIHMMAKNIRQEYGAEELNKAGKQSLV
jgi:hypothetical protein